MREYTPAVSKPSVDNIVNRLVRAERRAAALVEVGRLFASHRPLREVIQAVADKDMEVLADISIVHVADDRGPRGLLASAVAAREPATGDAVRAHLADHPIRFEDMTGARIVYETGEGIFLPDATEEDLARLTRPVDAPILKLLGLRSVMVVPLRGRDGVIGSMDLGATDPHRRYDREDFAFAQEIADRAAAAVENTRLVQRLESERSLLKHVIEQMPEGVVITDRDGRLILANRVAQDVDGFTVGRGDRLVQVEQSARRRVDGAEIPILVNSAPVHGEGGEIETVVAVFQDMSERKRVRDRLEELAKVAAERAQHLETVISCIADSVLVADAVGNVILANEAAGRLFGVPRESLLGPLAAYVDRFALRVPEGAAAGVKALEHEVIVGAECAITDASGAPHDLRVSAAPLLDVGGRAEGAVVIAGDITRLKELERARDEFISIAAHELKTPLTPLLATAEVLARAVERGETPEPLLTLRIVRQVSRLKALIADLLDVARAREGRLEIDRQPFALRPLVERVVEEYQGSIKTHTIEWLPPAGPLTVDGDEQRIEEVLVNLLENATKYSPAGSRITVELAPAGAMACISVRDRGIGIPQADLPFIFERFKRARNVVGGHYRGLGLGLFISREIVRLHEGEVTIDSVEHQGTCVSFTIPQIG